MNTQTKWMIGGAVVLAVGGYYWFYIRKPATAVASSIPQLGASQNAAAFGTPAAGGQSGGQQPPISILDRMSAGRQVSQGVWQQGGTVTPGGTLGQNPGV